MKRNLFKRMLSLILLALVFTGCKKSTDQELASVDDVNRRAGPGGHDNRCRLRSFVQSDGFNENFHYNDKGLADRWFIDYGDGTTFDYHMTYDKRNRLKNARMVIEGDAVNFTFYNTGNRTTRLTGFYESNGAPYADIYYTYNRKGQMISLDDNVADLHSRFTYDRMGNNNRIDFYIGSELFYTYLLTFDVPNKNPYLALNGVDFGFVSNFFLAPYFDKRWNNTGTFIIYDNGSPIVVADDDPAQTQLITGIGNYLTYAGYYDFVNEYYYDLRFEYENCGNENCDDKGINSASPVRATTAMSAKTKLRKIVEMRSGNMKQELMDFKKDCISRYKKGR